MTTCDLQFLTFSSGALGDILQAALPQGLAIRLDGGTRWADGATPQLRPLLLRTEQQPQEETPHEDL